VDGQIYGGVVQGIGEALSEEVIYNDRGELVTDSYADFVIPPLWTRPILSSGILKRPPPIRARNQGNGRIADHQRQGGHPQRH